MTLMSWGIDYEVSAPQISTEHQRLFELVNEFHEIYLYGDGRREIHKILNQLLAHAQPNFQPKKTLMIENDNAPHAPIAKTGTVDVD